MAILIVAEHDNVTLKPATLTAVTAAQQIGTDIHLLIAGDACDTVAETAKTISGIAKVLHANGSAYKNFLAENLAPLIVKLAPNYSHVMAPATTFGKNVMPRAAALCDVQLVSDITIVVAPDTFVRPIYAGNALATVKSSDKIIFVTVRPTAFATAPSSGGSAVIEIIPETGDLALSAFVAQELSKSERPELAQARVVIAGGRGMGSRENFALLTPIADKLNAAIGASRAAVDAGYVPNDYQVGQTGKIIAPDLYIAIGISGAIQHLAGMKDSKVIVAINKDGDAPIFQIADYGLVADLFEVLPELDRELAKVL
ncbi:MAG: FAD-binding protein [Alphaproteobacteria bacterium]